MLQLYYVRREESYSLGYFTTMEGCFADAVPAAAVASFAMPPEPPPALPACIGEMQEREMQERSALISQLDTQRRQIADMQNQINTLQRLLDESCMRRATSDVLRSNVSEWVWAWDGNSGNTRWSDRSDGNMPYPGSWSSDYNMPYHNGYHKWVRAVVWYRCLWNCAVMHQIMIRSGQVCLNPVRVGDVAQGHSGLRRFSRKGEAAPPNGGPWLQSMYVANACPCADWRLALTWLDLTWGAVQGEYDDGRIYYTLYHHHYLLYHIPYYTIIITIL